MKGHGKSVIATLLFAGTLAIAGCSSDSSDSTGSNSSVLGSGTGGGTTGGTTTGGTTTGGTTTGGTTTGGTPPPGAAGGIQFISATPGAIGVQGSGQITTSTVVFRVTDAATAPMAGQLVNFTMTGPQGGTYIGTPNDGTPTTASGTTDGSGNVAVILNSGNVAGPVTIRATVAAGIATFSASSSIISIGGAVASAGHLSISASILNLPGFVLDNFKSDVLVLAADRFTNSTILAGTTVSFYTEAGAVGASTTLDATGAGTVALRTQLPRPIDMPPTVGTGDPADGLSRIIAVMRGEEAFIDVNGNGVYDVGIDTFNPATMDFGEPFIDANDNGVFDPGEFYVDTNGNGVYDGPNGVWDGPGCVQAGCSQSPTIWISMNVLFTGNIVNCSLTPGSASLWSIAKGATLTFVFSVGDINQNSPVPGTTISFSTTGGTIAGPASYTVPDTNVAGPVVLPVTLSNSSAAADPSKGATLSATITPPAGQGVVVSGSCFNPTTSGQIQ